MSKIRTWLEGSNRKKHLIGVFLLSLFGTILMGIGAIIGMEFKDCPIATAMQTSLCVIGTGRHGTGTTYGLGWQGVCWLD